MAQYQIYTSGVQVTYTDGVDTFREGSRAGVWATDHTLTATGFAGAENTDWENIATLDAEGGIGIDTFRDGVRDGNYIVDKTLTATGFSGTESLDEGATGDWINLYPLTI
jgi:hypothetical protein